MFGLVERARLGMYEKTLTQTVLDAHGGAFVQRLAFAPAIAWLVRAVGIELRSTLRETIEAIPSAQLPHVDSYLVSRIVAPASMTEMPFFQALNAANGLVFVRLVEVTRPNLSARAWRLRERTLQFYEPAHAMMLDALRHSEKASAAPTSDSVWAGSADRIDRALLNGEHKAAVHEIPEGIPTSEVDSEGTARNTSASKDFALSRFVSITLFIVVGLAFSVIARSVFKGALHAGPPSYQYTHRAPVVPKPSLNADAQHMALVPALPVSSPFPPAGPGETNSSWQVSVSHDADADKSPSFKRNALAQLIVGRSCEQAKQDSQDFYSERAMQGKFVRMDMMEERMAVEYFACHPDAHVWSPNQ